MRKKPIFSQNVNNLLNCIFTRSDRKTKLMLNITMHTSEIREFKFSIGLHIYRNHSC